MKLIGEKIFAKDAEGRLLSRIGTMFFRTPGLVTQKGVHAMQRLMWLNALAAEKPLTPAEEEAELAESVDLIFTEDEVLIRPNPDRMDLAFRADEELQRLVSKRSIRFLNTSSAKVRAALRARGENWRMARQPISQEDMAELIRTSKVPVGEKPIYYYNRLTGTRYITASGYQEVEVMAMADFRRQIAEIVRGLNARNRLGRPEVDIFPTSTPIEIKRAFKELKVDDLSDAELKVQCDKLALAMRMALPTELREESPANFEWRNQMCQVLTTGPNATTAEEAELIAGIAPEFYRQIEWLPGVRINDGEVIFDAVYEAAATGADPELKALCDNRVKSFLFNVTRLLGALEYINVGRIVRSLARHPDATARRGHVYIVQYREAGSAVDRVQIVRLQKWGIAERLDEGKELLQAIAETDEYTDYILDRRLMCRQLGMVLPQRIDYGHFNETYDGTNRHYRGMAVRTPYFVRDYVSGIASDKILPAKFRNPTFAQRFAMLMGEAAAVDMVVGRRSSTTGACIFDQYFEVIRLDAAQMPESLLVTDHAGSFVEYEHAYETYVADYAAPILRRRNFVVDYASFAAAYASAFRNRLAEVQQAYRRRRRAFDALFADRPYDTNGSGAYRWALALKRLDECEVERTVTALKTALSC